MVIIVCADTRFTGLVCTSLIVEGIDFVPHF